MQKENATISLENHLLLIIDQAIDFNFIYEEVEGLYSEKVRPGIDPVSFFIHGIRSMRQIIKEIEVNMAFSGYSLTEPVLHFSTFGKNYVRRFADSYIFARIFKKILEETQKSGYVDNGEHERCFACLNLKKLALKKLQKPLAFNEIFAPANLKAPLIEKGFGYNLGRTLKSLPKFFKKNYCKLNFSYLFLRQGF